MKGYGELRLNVTRISELLTNLQELTNLRFSLHTIGAEELVTANRRSEFCNLICQTKNGYKKCFESDLAGIEAVKSLEEPYQYRCHAGVIDTTIPIMDHGNLIAIIFFGQILDDSPIETQWRRTEKMIQWHSDPMALKNAFYRLPRLSGRAIRAAYEIINTCVSEVRLSQMVSLEQMTDYERLMMYLKSHYKEVLTADKISEDLAMSKSRLYRAVSESSSGKSLNQLITEERVYVAKKLLKTTSASIREIGSSVGIYDYNYFAKIFKKVTGRTPTDYRKEKLKISATRYLGNE